MQYGDLGCLCNPEELFSDNTLLSDYESRLIVIWSHL